MIRDTEGAREFRSGAGLRTGLAAFPAHDRRALHAHHLGQPFLTETGRLASADQSVPLAFHAVAPLKGRIGQYTLRMEAGSAVLLQQCR